MMEEHEFPKTDKQVRFDVGAFVKTDIPPAQVANVELPVVNPPEHISQFKEMPEETRPPLTGEVYLPGLKPGPDGKVDWTPLGNMTGTRPPVNIYSLSKYSQDERRKHHEDIVNPDIITESNTVEYNAKTSTMLAFGNIDKEQLENNIRLKQKAKDIFRWKVEAERACKAITEELELLEIQKQRLKSALRTLMLPESICKECIDLRSNRSQIDRVADLAELELIKEKNLVNEVQVTLKHTLQLVEEQMAINQASKDRIEYYWSDKKSAYNTETMNVGMNSNSGQILFRLGATRFSQHTAPLEYWDYFCRENIQIVETTRQKSAELRWNLNAILMNSSKKLRNQAYQTDKALVEMNAITHQMCATSESTLHTTLQKIVDIESLIFNLNISIRKTDGAMKLAQTRLDNRNKLRPHGENVRDQPHFGLIAEVKKIHEAVTLLRAQLNNAERAREDLIKKRVALERDINIKRNTLTIDKDRCGMVRLHYPSEAELAGY